MKPHQLIRPIVMLVAMVTSIVILESVRKHHKNGVVKKMNVSRRPGSSNISNTEYIFFESISKYLFTSLVN